MSTEGRSIGIMGGAFDPIHIGHLIAADTAMEKAGLDEVWFIPSYGSPLKANEPGCQPSDRLAMTEAAVKHNPSFKVLDIELRRGGTSYSIDTARQLVQQYPSCTFHYIIGSDRINDLVQWRSIEQLAELVSFIGLCRPSDTPQLEGLPPFLQKRLMMADMPGIAISSTAIRAKLREGRSVRYQIPSEVQLYIERRELYGSAANHGCS